MTHTIIATKHGFIVASSIAGIVTSAELFTDYGKALSAIILLTA